MQTNVWRIVWREKGSGNIVETSAIDYLSWKDADSALTTLLGYRRNWTPTIEREVVKVEEVRA